MPERPLAAITGASAGIGAEFARQLAQRGYALLLIARRADKLSALAQEVSVPVEVMAADLVIEAECERVAQRLRTDPNLAVLVNNAGFGTLGLFPQTELESQQRMNKLHVLAASTLTHAALQNLTAREAAGALPDQPCGIINVASIASFGQSPSNVSYCATKAWTASFTEGLALELGTSGSRIRAQALCPGFTYSEFHDVMKMDRRSVPESFWLKADYVVRESLAGFDRGDVFVIPNWRYRFIANFLKLTPKSLIHKVTIQLARYRQKRIQRARGPKRGSPQALK
ncbi:MAG: SDR family NAD(P)-dependent oxidoreductase [Bryobacteraceae bacterium]